MVAAVEDGQTQTQDIQADQAAAQAGQDQTASVQLHNHLNQEIQVLMDLEIQEALHQEEGVLNLAQEAEEQGQQEQVEVLTHLQDQAVLAVLILFQVHL